MSYGKFALIYEHVSGTNYARKPRYHCILTIGISMILPKDQKFNIAEIYLTSCKKNKLLTGMFLHWYDTFNCYYYIKDYYYKKKYVMGSVPTIVY
jgi:hypothetical protein